MCPENSQQTHSSPSGPNQKGALVRLLLPIVVVIVSAAVAFWMMQSGPKAKPRPKVRNAVLVDVRPVEFGPQTTTVNVMGTVKAQREVTIKPQVSGEIIAMSNNLIPGGRFTKDAALLSIDPSDYQLAVDQIASEVARSEADLAMELGRQRVARKEYELLDEKVSSEEEALILREPQLANNQALLEGTRARLEQARLNLNRTVVKTPFNAVIMTREVNLGTRVSPSTNLATLVGTDNYWVEAPISASQLKWINTGKQGKETGSSVRIYDSAAWGPGIYRSGQLIGMTAMVEENGRMAKILASITDPLNLKSSSEDLPELLLGSYVRVEIEGKTLSSAAVIERDLVRDGDRLWVMDDTGHLDIREVEIAFRGQDHVLVTDGIRDGELLVISNLPSPVQGMSLRLKDAEPTAPAAKGNDKP